jgi:TonB family protein
MQQLAAILGLAILLTSCVTPTSKYFKYATSSPSKPAKKSSLQNPEKLESGYFLNLRKAIELTWVYPKEAVQAGLEGTVQITFKILQDGNVKNIICDKSSGHFVLDESIAKAISEAAPFSPIPASFNKKQLLVTGTFNYVMSPNDKTPTRETFLESKAP